MNFPNTTKRTLMRTACSDYEWLPTYFEGRDDCAAYLIYAEESLAGFALINRIAEW